MPALLFAPRQMNISSSTRPLLIKTFLSSRGSSIENFHRYLPARLTSSSTSRFVLLLIPLERTIDRRDSFGPVSPFSIRLNFALSFRLSSTANESLSSSGGGALWTDAHDRDESVGLVERPCTGNETRDFDVLQPGEQLVKDLPQIR